MAVTWRSVSSAIEFDESTPLACAEPTGTVEGDVMVVVFYATLCDGLTLPAGWTELYSGSQGDMRWKVAWITRGASAPDLDFVYSTFTEPIPIVEITTFQKSSGNPIRLDSQSAAGSSGTDNTTYPDAPSTTAVAASSLAVAFGVHWGAVTGGFTAPTGYTEHNEGTGFLKAGWAVKSLSAAGAENPDAFGGGAHFGSSDWWNGFTITLTDEPESQRRWLLGAH
jgi:hypothetical protein